MNVLIAADDPVTSHLLESAVGKWGYNVIMARDGNRVSTALQSEDSPWLVVLDGITLEVDGLEICQRIRQSLSSRLVYIIILFSESGKEDTVKGLKSGVDDYMVKPFREDELHARLQVGFRTLELQKKLAERIKELEEAQSWIKQLHGLLPICSYCKRIRSDQNYWKQVETYISKHSEAIFNHSLCPECYKSLVEPEIDELMHHLRLVD